MCQYAVLQFTEQCTVFQVVITMNTKAKLEKGSYSSLAFKKMLLCQYLEEEKSSNLGCDCHELQGGGLLCNKSEVM